MIAKILRKSKQKLPETIPGLTRMLCLNFSPIGSAVLEKLKINVCFRAKKVDDRENIAKIQKKKLPETFPGPTQMFCVKFSPLSSTVLEKLEKLRFPREKGR